MNIPMERTIKSILAELSHDEYHTIDGSLLTGKVGKKLCRYCHFALDVGGAHGFDCPIGTIINIVEDTLGGETIQFSSDTPKELIEGFVDELETDVMNASEEGRCRYCSVHVEPSEYSLAEDHADWCPMGLIVRAVNQALWIKGGTCTFSSVVPDNETVAVPGTGLTTVLPSPRGKNQKRILGFLRGHRVQDYTAAELAKQVGIKGDTLRGCLRRLLKKELVFKFEETGEPVRWRAP